MLKKILFLLLMCLLLTGCSDTPAESRPTVVAVIFPEYDWARQIIGTCDGIDLQLLVDDGVDPHSFQPTVADMVAVSRCDLLIYGGGESDAWLEDVLDEPMNPEMRAIALMSLLGSRAVEAEVVNGMQIREVEEETDEHVWLSLRNAVLFCEAIAEELCALDPDHADEYRQNLESYLEELRALDEQYRIILGESPKNTIVLCDRFPFRYLTEDYGLGYYAAFPGCSSESGASFATVVFLTDRARELELNVVLTLEGSDGRLAATVAEGAGLNAEVLALDSMQSVSARDAAHCDYLGIMEQNLQVLAQALR